MDELSVLEVDADMGDVHIIPGEEYEISRLELALVDRNSDFGLDVSGAGKIDTALAIDILNETGAVKTARGGTAIDVRNSKVLHGSRNETAVASYVAAANLGELTAEEGAVYGRARKAVDFHSVGFLVVAKRRFGCRAKFTIHSDIVAGFRQSALYVHDRIAPVTEPEGSGIARGGNQETSGGKKEHA